MLSLAVDQSRDQDNATASVARPLGVEIESTPSGRENCRWPLKILVCDWLLVFTAAADEKNR
jgi:hypothetical protein